MKLTFSIKINNSKIQIGTDYDFKYTIKLNFNFTAFI